jgi:small subunit ribosomal protein S17
MNIENSQRSKRKVLSGTVTSKMGDKSVKVTVPYKSRHARYLKVINRKSVLHVHDEANVAKVGDLVEVMETRPISRLKRFRVTRVIESAPTQVAVLKDVTIETPSQD